MANMHSVSVSSFSPSCMSMFSSFPLSSWKLWNQSSLNGKPQRMNFFFFPAINEIPKAPRGRFSRNTWHGQFVNACMQSGHTQTHTHIQMFVLTEPVHQLSESYIFACFSAPCLLLSFSGVLLSKQRSRLCKAPPLHCFWKYLRRFKYSSNAEKTLNEQDIIKKKSPIFFRPKQMENWKLLLSVNVVTKGNWGHTPAWVACLLVCETIRRPTVLTPHIPLILFSRKIAGILYPPYY